MLAFDLVELPSGFQPILAVHLRPGIVVDLLDRALDIDRGRIFVAGTAVAASPGLPWQAVLPPSRAQPVITSAAAESIRMLKDRVLNARAFKDMPLP